MQLVIEQKPGVAAMCTSQAEASGITMHGVQALCLRWHAQLARVELERWPLS